MGEVGGFDIWDTQGIAGSISQSVAVVDQAVPIEVSLAP